MTEEALKASIAEIKTLMQGALDNHERELLGRLVTDVSRRVGGESVDDEALSEQVDEQAISFETRHPAIARVLREIMDTLQKMGI